MTETPNELLDDIELLLDQTQVGLTLATNRVHAFPLKAPSTPHDLGELFFLTNALEYHLKDAAQRLAELRAAVEATQGKM